MAAKPENHEDHLVEVLQETRSIDGDDCSLKVYRNIKTGELVTKAEPIHSSTDHWLIIGDCTSILPEIPSDSIDLILTSPPYYNVSKYYADLFPTLDHWKSLMENVASESMRLLQEGHIIAINISDPIIKGLKYPLTSIVTSIFMDVGLKYRDSIVWRKPNATVRASKRNFGWPAQPFPNRLFLNSVHENILLFQKGTYDISSIPPKTLEMSQISPWEARCNFWHLDVWDLDIPYPKPESERKIATFPDELAYRIIKLYSHIGGIVLDPLSGTGTVCKVSRTLYRSSISCELRREYVNIIRNKCGFNSNGFKYGTPQDTFTVIDRSQRKRRRK